VSDAPSTPLCFFLPQGARRDASRIKPGRLYLASSAIAITISLFFLSLSLASFWDYRQDLPAWLVCLPFALATGLLQYHAVFRHGATSAKWLAGILIPTHGLLLLATLVMTSESRPCTLKEWAIFGAIFCLGAFGVTCGILNLRWASYLRACASHGVAIERQPLIQFSLWRLSGWTVAVAVCAGTTYWFVSQIPPRYGENVTAAEAWLDLPDAATDACFWRWQRGRIAYEFTIDEAGFRSWVELLIRQEDAKIEQVSIARIDEPYDIMRYCRFRTSAEEGGYATVSRGYYVQWSKSSWFPHAVYDLDARRAYYDGYSR
jgi:hypothetical protein